MLSPKGPGVAVPDPEHRSGACPQGLLGRISQRLPSASRERPVFRLEQAGWKRLLFLPSQTQRETSKAFMSRRHKGHRAGEAEVKP